MARLLSTIQKRNKLNSVFALDNPEHGANYKYEIASIGTPDIDMVIQFQKGARKDPSAIPGVIDTDLLEIVRDRLKAFQSGEFACKENEMALMYVEEALLWMNKRVEDRAEREVLGTYKK